MLAQQQRHAAFRRSGRSAAAMRPTVHATRCRPARAAPAAAPTAQAVSFDDFEAYVLDLQKRILSEAELLDGSGQKFVHDRWERDAGNPNAGKAHARNPFLTTQLIRRPWSCISMPSLDWPNGHATLY